MKINLGNELLHSWITQDNPYNDVVLSTEIELYRNSPNYPFVRKMTKEQKKELAQLVVSIFNEIDNDNFAIRNICSMDYSTENLLSNLKFFNSNKNNNISFTDIIYDKNDFSNCCLLNHKEHFMFKGIVAGFDLENTYKKAKELESIVGKKIEYAKNKQFGYLTSNIIDSGTGFKPSITLYIPCIALSGEYKELCNVLEENHFWLNRLGQKVEFNNPDSFLFTLNMHSSVDGTIEEQLESIKSMSKMIIEKERKLRAKVADNYPTIVLDKINRSLCIRDNALLLDYSEALDVILGFKLGLNLGLLKGITNKELNAWFYLIQEGILKKFLYIHNDFTFEKDVIDNILLIKRMRAIVIQNGLTGITYGDKTRGS